MEEGHKVVCLYDDWYCAFGSQEACVHKGMRLTIRDTLVIGGFRFYSFEEAPESQFYMSIGFGPDKRRLN